MPSGSIIEMGPLSGCINEICHTLGRVYSGSRAPLSAPDARLSGVQVDVAPALLEPLRANGALVLVLGRLPLARSTTGFLLLPSGLPLGLLPGPGGLCPSPCGRTRPLSPPPTGAGHPPSPQRAPLSQRGLSLCGLRPPLSPRRTPPWSCRRRVSPAGCCSKLVDRL